MELPDNILSFASSSVNQVLNINSVTIKNSQIYSSYKGFLFNSDKTQLIFVPRKVTSESEIPFIDKIQTIDSYCLTSTHIITFVGRSELSTVLYASFHAMKYLRTVDFRKTKITTLSNSLFFSSSLMNLYLPACLETVETNAFQETQYLKLVVFFDNVTQIQQSAFINCKRLEKIIYFGEYDFGNVTMFYEMPYSHLIKVCVTDEYKGTKFGLIPVDFDCYRINPHTCNHKSQRFSFIFTYIIFAHYSSL